MSTDQARHPRIRASIVALVVALGVGACGGSVASPAPSVAATAAPTPSAPPSAGPTASPAPTASTSGSDVSGAFIKIVSAPGFSATAEIKGSVTIGAIDGQINGAGTFSGNDSSGTTTVSAGTVTQITESVSIGNRSWARKPPGPWLEKPAETVASSRSMGDVLTAIVSVVDLGVETYAGRQLHHLQPTGGNDISADAIGFDVGNATDASFTMDLYATDDGTPAIMAVGGSWTQGTGTTSVPITVLFDLVFSDVGKPQAIEPPDDVWIRHTSKALGYTMAHPADWTVKSEKRKDTYLLNDQGYVYVATAPYKGTTANLVIALKASYVAQLGAEPTSETPTTLGGQPAVRLVYEYTNDSGQDVTVADDVISRNGTEWEVFLATGGGAEDVEIFDGFVSTFEFTD